ncbi:hypothetical protein H6P81_006868 [Aristolochia fimbriata]|uniref:Integrase zinc-binding domain-containing protein n=1 Tax=Aristolochia fimbriata TaxID=158543 RepID=A0AAV7EZP2_ARIFI|nr:hypothetical protein H6P81_006868 [Aristolochia fimbriata]
MICQVNTSQVPWYADIAIFVCSKWVPKHFTNQQRKKLMADSKHYYWEDPFLNKICPDQVIRWCVKVEEAPLILSHCHDKEVGGHHSANRIAAKVLQSGFFWPTLFRDAKRRFMTRSLVDSPQEIDPEPERALRQRLKENQNQSTPKEQEDMKNLEARQHPPEFKPLQTEVQQKEIGVEEDWKLMRALYADVQSLKTMQTDIQSVKQSVTLLTTQVNQHTTQVNQLNRDVYERPRGALPSNSEVNPKEQVKAITFRSGKTLEELQTKEQSAIEEEQNQKGEEEQEREKVSPPASPRKKKRKDALPITDIYIRHLPYPSGAKTDILPITDIDIRHLPYPSGAKTDILESSFSRFLETFKTLKINIPLLEAVRQMPLYGKFLKEILSGKRKMEEQGTVVLNENCSAILKNELPTKLKDPGSFTIPCEIGSNKFANALCDLGASVNLMPLSLCRYLNLGEPQETGITLQFTGRSTKIPEGVDVLVKIQDFIYPCDFVVLDMEVDKNLPIILGRPFLATTGAIIDCKHGNLTLRLNNDTISFNKKEAMKQPAIPHDDFCLSIVVIDSCIAEIEEEARIEAAKEGGLVNSEEREDEDPIMTREVDELEAESKEEGIKEQGAEGASKPELKPLPNNLKYVFLEENDKRVIISSCLTGLEEKMLFEVLSKHKKAIGWSLADIEGISPTICTHQILMEDNYKTNIQPQRRLNPTLQEVVKKEVIKLLDVGIIYPISDSAWVSLVQVVPKKGVPLSFTMKIMN